MGSHEPQICIMRQNTPYHCFLFNSKLMEQQAHLYFVLAILCSTEERQPDKSVTSVPSFTHTHRDLGLCQVLGR